MQSNSIVNDVAACTVLLLFPIVSFAAASFVAYVLGKFVQ
jgi:hypothetical protein